MRHHTDRIIHTTAFVTSVVEHWLERGSNRPTSNRLTIVMINNCFQHRTTLMQFFLSFFRVRQYSKFRIKKFALRKPTIYFQGSFICSCSQTGIHIPQSLIYQSLGIGSDGQPTRNWATDVV